MVTFRSDDTCVSVMREMRRFVVDTLSHHPQLKLEWIAMGEDGRAQRVMRRSGSSSSSSSSGPGSSSAADKKAEKKKKKGKEKWKGPPVDANGHLNDAGYYPVFPAHGWEPDSSDTDEDDEYDDYGGGGGGGGGGGSSSSSTDGRPTSLKLELTENIAFYDIWGVQIFRKEIVAGRL